MAKRDSVDETVEPEMVDDEVLTVGQRLRAAREERGLALEDVASQTRIPLRHLESIETAQWDNLPAPTYTVGFAKSYASAVGLDRSEIGDQLREEMGGQRFASNQTEVIEPADPARTMPKWLVIGAILGVILLIAVMSWLSRRSLHDDGQPAVTAQAPSTPAQPAPQAATATPAAQGPVVVTAVAPAWIQVTDQGKSLFEGELQPGQAFTVPATATAPLLKAGKPEALKITVGSAVAPPVGPAGKVASKVSLKGEDLMRVGGSAAATPGAAIPAAR
jgi:cytoskeletal protein RodZ